MRYFPILAALALVVPAPALAATETVRCSIDYAPARACRMNVTTQDGVRRLVFAVGGQHIRFVGRAQSGWWSGTLNGKPAMGFERNRGHVVFSTTDLRTRFAWWYPESEHGTY